MKVGLPVLLRVADTFFQDVLGLLDKLTMEVNSILRDTTLRVVFSEDELARLLVVIGHLSGMTLAFLTQLLSGSSIAILVCLL